MPIHHIEHEVKYYCRAKYYTTATGEVKLAQIQELGFPSFRLPDFEDVTKEKLVAIFDVAEEREKDDVKHTPEEVNRRRALRRAKINAFDKILCNPDLDLFATFTLSPEAVSDRAAWSDCYKCLKVWLSNRVARHDLKYVICPERHEKGGIHFHGIMNSTALDLTEARHAHTGQPLTHNGNRLYNVASWRYGYTSAEKIETTTLDREKVAKYIFKYMGKQGTGGMIGGRYALIGGRLAAPIYEYANTVAEFEAREAAFTRSVEFDGITYREWSYI